MRLVCKQNSFSEKQKKIRTLVPNGNGMKQIDDCNDESRYKAHLLYKSWILDQLLNNLCVCILSAPKEWKQKHDVTKRFLFEKLAKQVWKRLKTTEYKFNA